MEGTLIRSAGAFLTGRSLACPSPAAEGTAVHAADAVLRELLAGNERFATDQAKNPRRSPADFRAVAEGQNPVAVIVTCSDSRVSPEILFDVGVGDLFVIRVAGNVVSGAGATVNGSIEFAVAELKVPLVVVLGHGSCGAVTAAVAHIDRKDSLPGAINDLVELIKPAVTHAKGQPGDPLDNAIRENVKLGALKLRGLEPILAPRVKEGRVKVIGAVYDLHTGRVTLVD